VGWLNYFPQETDVDSWADIINHWIEKNFKPEGGKAPTVIGLEYRAIYDGLGMEACKRMTDKERWAKRLYTLSASGAKRLE
jgi:hypothetical protein